VDETQARKRRKQEGALYTPAFITRYIVGQALGGVLKQRFENLRQQHEAEAVVTARKALADHNADDWTALNEPGGPIPQVSGLCLPGLLLSLAFRAIRNIKNRRGSPRGTLGSPGRLAVALRSKLRPFRASVKP
jgi:hypothetical protein